MTKKAVQQIMLGTVTKNETQARETLKAIKAAGYDGIELNGFMIKPTSFLVRTMTKAAGMPVGKGGNLDWSGMLRDTGLAAVSVHSMELGYGNMDLEALVRQALSVDVDAVILETHRNWVDRSPIKSLQVSAAFMNKHIPR